MARILVADDDRDILELVQIGLTRLGLEVSTYGNGSDVIEAVLTDPPDLIILDIEMPTSGLEVTKALRSTPGIKDIPIILFTARAMPEDRNLGYEAGAKHYITKPFSISALGAYVQRILEETQNER